MALEYFPCYDSYMKKTENLSDQELGRLFRALMKYHADGERAQLAGRETIAFDFIVDDIDRATTAYETKCRKNKENGAMANGGRRTQSAANGTERPPNTNTKPNTKANISPISSDEDISPARKNTGKKFVRPTVEEIAAFCTENGYPVDANCFFDYYEANGWMAGKNHMKDWKATVRNWVRRDSGMQKNPVGKDVRVSGTLGEAELEAIRQVMAAPNFEEDPL